MPMANETRGRSVPGLLSLVGRALLLAPEAVPLTALMCVYLAWRVPLVALLAALLVIAFMVRAAALHMARALIERGQTDEAGALIKLALLLYPWSPDALALAGFAALTRGDAAQAEERLRQALDLLPGQPAFHAALSGA